MPQPTEYELDQLIRHPVGPCELVFNEAHFVKVVRQGMARAQISLDIMTADFKAMLVPLRNSKLRSARARKADSIVHLFRRLADRGVEIRILHAGTPSGPALVQLKRALAPPPDNKRRGKCSSEVTLAAGPGNLPIRRCPRLHAKAVIIDARAMYLGSANLTGAGLGAKSAHKRNFEIGIWTDSSPLIEAVSGQFNQLWEGYGCRTCQRKDICPVPLEEPRL
jgi:phosphatidylserine/phosphatidylglycerophosphate/cardiolipin synthase-like enzyme